MTMFYSNTKCSKVEGNAVYSEKDNIYINVDMLAVVREIEKLSEKQFVYTGSKKRKTKRRMK